MYVVEGFCSVEVFPLPKFQIYVIEPDEVDVFVNVTESAAVQANKGDAVNEALGGATTVIVFTLEVVHPFVSVIITLTG